MGFGVAWSLLPGNTYDSFGYATHAYGILEKNLLNGHPSDKGNPFP
jgi:hypothetical protein